MVRIASWRQHGVHEVRETKAIGCSQAQPNTGKYRLAQPTRTAGKHVLYSNEAVQRRG